MAARVLMRRRTGPPFTSPPFTTDPLPNPLHSIPPTGDSSEIAQMTDEAGGDANELDSDSDFDDGDNVIARGYPRNLDHLERHGFRPVWTHWAGYSGEIPDDIGEYLDENGECSESSC